IRLDVESCPVLMNLYDLCLVPIDRSCRRLITWLLLLCGDRRSVYRCAELLRLRLKAGWLCRASWLSLVSARLCLLSLLLILRHVRAVPLVMLRRSLVIRIERNIIRIHFLRLAESALCLIVYVLCP